MLGIFKMRLIWGLIVGGIVLAMVLVGSLVILVGGLAGSESQQEDSTSGCTGSGNAVNAGAP
ncbi:MAG: hypothetical protein J2O46_02540, partial [Nocardioides sp.]|nr:hypothetical protein [Nocardioides sp.]